MIEEEIKCTKMTEGSQIVVKCGHETFYEEEAKDKPGSPAFFRDIALCIFFVLTAGTIYHFVPYLTASPATKRKKALFLKSHSDSFFILTHSQASCLALPSAFLAWILIP